MWPKHFSQDRYHGYESKCAIKSQCLADFSAKLTPQQGLSAGWTIHVDDSSNKTVCGAEVVFNGLGDLLLEQTFQFGFKATNNQAEYEAILARQNLAYDMGARDVTCKSDTQLVVGQIKEEFEVKEPLLQKYYHTVSNLIARFKRVMMEHICREDNMRAHALSRLSKTKKKSHHRFVVQIYLKQPVWERLSVWP